MLMEMGNINYLPVFVGGIVYILYGGIYYSLVLKNKIKNKVILEHQSEGPFKYIYSVIIAFVSSLFMAVLIQSIVHDQLLVSIGIGFMFGLLISIVYVKNALFGLMSRKSLLIALGDHLIIFTLLGLIHGLFI